MCNTGVYLTHVVYVLEYRCNTCVADTCVIHLLYTYNSHKPPHMSNMKWWIINITLILCISEEKTFYGMFTERVHIVYQAKGACNMFAEIVGISIRKRIYSMLIEWGIVWCQWKCSYSMSMAVDHFYVLGKGSCSMSGKSVL